MQEQEMLNDKIIEEHGFLEGEYELIVKLLGRHPNLTELGIFSVMWSEHCSYKNSKKLLKQLPTKHEKMLIKAGEENAGVVDIGDNLGLVFKIESHNHPSAVEPYQGAATGVGGIIRDIFTMGARPLVCMNSLRFGPLSSSRVPFLLNGVVEGIAGYGNCIGIPTVGGEIMFNSTYSQNPLVNVFCLGVIDHEDIIRGAAKGKGNRVLYVGAPTGRDGIHGATFASDDLTEESESKKSAVQVGDPFMEKLLLEACLEVIKKKLVVGIQDMGAAGLTCSTCETASRGDSGIVIDVAKVPKREKGMTPYEVMLSESQERMLLIVDPSNVEEVKAYFDKWDLCAEDIGYVDDGDRMKVYDHDQLVADLPVKSLADDAPFYTREEIIPSYLNTLKQVDWSLVEKQVDYNKSLLTLMSSPNIASKAWVYEQYDHMVQTNTLVCPGSDAAVIRLKEADKAIAMKLDGQGRYCYVNPYIGGKIAVAEAYRNVACTGVKPLASTDCLNFGNPLNPEVYWTLHQSIKGIGEACSYLDIPITGGNVSLYNQNPEGAIFPTPIIGVVGMRDGIDKDNSFINTQWFKEEGDEIFLLGENKKELGASEFYEVILNDIVGPCPDIDLNQEKILADVIYEATSQRLLSSTHDCSEGGLAVALAECCISGKKAIGAEICLSEEFEPNALLFGETQSRVIVSVNPQKAEKLKELCKLKKINIQSIGYVKGSSLVINDFINLSCHDLSDRWKSSLEKYL